MTDRFDPELLDLFWTFTAERQAIYNRRRRGEKPPWTSDPVLTRYKFTNVYRAADRVSQWLIRNVLYKGDQDPAELVYRALLFRIFNAPTAYRAIEIGIHAQPSRANFDPHRYGDILHHYQDMGGVVWGDAYMITPPHSSYSRGAGSKIYGWLENLKAMLQEDVPSTIPDIPAMSEVYELLLSFPTVGTFFAYQWTVDINYSTATNFSEDSWVMPGPGAVRGYNKLLSESVRERVGHPRFGVRPVQDGIAELVESQSSAFASRGLGFGRLGGKRPLSSVDIQNLLCEFDKYTRAVRPDLQVGRSYAHIKHRFDPRAAYNEHTPIAEFYPPKWGLDIEGVVS